MDRKKGRKKNRNRRIGAVGLEPRDWSSGIGAKTMTEKRLKASFSVEASLVISLTLLFFAVLMNGILGIHRRSVEEMILAEGVEKNAVFEETAELEEGRTRKDVTESENAKVHCFYGCGGAEITYGRRGLFHVVGNVRDQHEIEISMRIYDPENMLRLQTAILKGR